MTPTALHPKHSLAPHYGVTTPPSPLVAVPYALIAATIAVP